MIQRQRRDHDLLPFLDDRVPLLVQLLHVGVDLLHIGDQVAMSQHGAFSHASRPAGVLQDRNIVQRQRHWLEPMPSAIPQHVLERHGLGQAVRRHHLFHMLDRGVDQQPLERRQHVADTRLDEDLDTRIGYDLLYQLAEGIQVYQRPCTGILELVAHLPRGVQRVGVDHDQPGTQGTEDSNRVLQQVGHLYRDAIAGLQVSVVLQPGRESRRVPLQVRIGQRHAHVAECGTVCVCLAGALEYFHNRAKAAHIHVVRHTGGAFVIPEVRLHCYWPLYLRVSDPLAAGCGELNSSAVRCNSEAGVISDVNLRPLLQTTRHGTTPSQSSRMQPLGRLLRSAFRSDGSYCGGFCRLYPHSEVYA